jgi:anaerobic C4-dicarboxylate transporter
MSAKSQLQRGQDTELPLTKLLRFMGWVYLGLIICVVASMGLRSLSPGVSFKDTLSIETVILLFIFAGVSGLSFGVGVEIRTNPEKKKELFRSYMTAIILLSIIEILVMAAYQW